MSRPPQFPRWRFRSARPCIDPYRAHLRLLFLKEVDELVPEAAPRLVEVVADRFGAFLSETGFQLPGKVRLDDLLDDSGTSVIASGLSLTSLRSAVASVIPFLEAERECVDADCPRCGDELTRARNELFSGERGPRLAALLEDVRGLLVEWAKPYNLHADPWIRNHALGLLHSHLDDRRLSDLTRLGTRGEHLHCVAYWPGFIPEIGFEFPHIEPNQLGPVPGEGPAQRGSRKADFSEMVWRATGGVQELAMTATGWKTPPMRPYNPALDSREAYSKAVGQYMDRIENRYREAGWEPVPEIDALRTYSSWLARFQVPRVTFPNGERHEDISRCPSRPGLEKTKTARGSSLANVKQQIRRLAEELGLTRRSLI